MQARRRARQSCRRIAAEMLTALVALCGVASCTASRPPETARNFVLVTIDTLRADRVGVYGGGDLTPRLDRIAREGAYAADAMSQVPLTRPSHVEASSIEGCHVRLHSAREDDLVRGADAGPRRQL